MHPRRIGCLAALACVVVASDASAQAPALAVGDSLGVGVEPYLAQTIPGIEQDNQIARPLAEGMRILRSHDLPPVVIVSLGTNDDPSFPSRFGAAVDELVARAGPERCIIWPDIAGNDDYGSFNRILAARAGPRFIVVPWTQIARAGGLEADGVHPNAQGYRARATAITEAYSQCQAGQLEAAPAPTEPRPPAPETDRPRAPPRDAGPNLSALRELASYLGGELAMLEHNLRAMLAGVEDLADRAGQGFFEEKRQVLGVPSI